MFVKSQIKLGKMKVEMFSYQKPSLPNNIIDSSVDYTPKKYKKIPEIVDAVQYIAGNEHAVINFLGNYDIKDEISNGIFETNNAIFIHNYFSNIINIKLKTKNKRHIKVYNGDYIIKNKQGHFYKCDEKQFNKQYKLI